MTLLVTLCGIITVLILGYMAFLFWRDPVDGMRQTNHKIEILPRVMADRYSAFTVLAVVLTIYGDLWLMAALFAVCAFMGFADGYIYKRANLSHMKHTASGVLSVVALGVTLLAIALT